MSTRLVGHANELAQLRRELAAGQHHAYLVSGPSGIGKSTFVTQVLEELVCTSGEPGVCGRCEACRQLAAGTYPDVWHVRREPKAQNISIDQVRALQQFVSLESFTGASRYVVIDDVAELSAEAQHALLKTLEEPPPAVGFFLVTASEREVLRTIRSRCSQVRLGLVPAAALVELLLSQGVHDPEAKQLAVRAAGRPAVALALIHDPERTEREDQYVREFLALMARKPWFDFQKLLVRDLADDVSEGQRTVAFSLVAAWQQAARDVLLAKLGLARLCVYQNLLPELHSVAAAHSLVGLVAVGHRLRLGHLRLQGNAHVRLTLEWLALSLPHL